jgi:hypothetical protein
LLYNPPYEGPERLSDLIVRPYSVTLAFSWNSIFLSFYALVICPSDGIVALTLYRLSAVVRYVAEPVPGTPPIYSGDPEKEEKYPNV